MKLHRNYLEIGLNWYIEYYFYLATHFLMILMSLQNKHKVNRRYLEGRIVTPRMRTILVDWIVQVHSRFNLMQETLYLTIALLDRYLQVRNNELSP